MATAAVATKKPQSPKKKEFVPAPEHISQPTKQMEENYRPKPVPVAAVKQPRTASHNPMATGTGISSIYQVINVIYILTYSFF